MKDYLSVIRSSQLFSGVSEEEVIAMLSCLKAERKDFPKDAFLLRAGDTAESIGLVLSGSVWSYRRISGETAIFFPKRGRGRPLPPRSPAPPAPG